MRSKSREFAIGALNFIKIFGNENSVNTKVKMHEIDHVYQEKLTVVKSVWRITVLVVNEENIRKNGHINTGTIPQYTAKRTTQKKQLTYIHVLLNESTPVYVETEILHHQDHVCLCIWTTLVPLCLWYRHQLGISLIISVQFGRTQFCWLQSDIMTFYLCCVKKLGV